MSDKQLTEEDVLAAIVTDSTQLNVADVIDGPMTVKIENTTQGTEQQPANLHLVGHDRVYRPCKTSLRILKKLYGSNPNAWVGESITLYNDPSVKYGAATTGGIRISHASGIDKPTKVPIVLSRGKNQEVTILPLQVEKPVELTEEDQKFITAATEELKEAATSHELEVYGQILHGQTKAVQDALRTLYKQRKQELTEAKPNKEPKL